MAQNVTVAGASYSDVPSVTLPKTGGGTASFTDVTGTTAIASDVASGKYFFTASGTLTLGTASSGTSGGTVTQDQDGYLVLDDDSGSTTTTLITKSVTANGTYAASTDGADGYSSVTVAVGGMSESDLGAYIQRNGSFKTIEWPSGMTKIGNYAFADCYAFNTASLPNGITQIGTYAFYNCQALTLTSLPNTLTSIGDYAFRNCYNLKLTSLPSGLTTIGTYAFTWCYRMSLASLPSGITSIGSSAFSNCQAITLSELPDSVVSIQNYAFAYCTSITSISCDGAITTLGNGAFAGDSTYAMQLTSASFPNMAITSNFSNVFGSTIAANACQLLEFCDIGSTAGLGANAFANCYALETLVLRKTSSVCTLTNVSAFTNTPMCGYNNLTGTVYVPSALISSYQTATNWSTLYNDGTVTFSAIEGSDYELD